MFGLRKPKPLRHVSEAARELGICEPVQVFEVMDKGHLGSYAGMKMREDGPGLAHTILVRPGERGRVIWHELMHALQTERDFDGDYDAFYAEYQAELARRLNRARCSRNTLHALIKREVRARGCSIEQTRAYQAYHGLPQEVEARAGERQERLAI